jgi:hypothetical protein
MTTQEFHNWVFDQHLDLVQDDVFNVHRVSTNFMVNPDSDLEEVQMENSGLFFGWFNRFNQNVMGTPARDRQLYMQLCNN